MAKRGQPVIKITELDQVCVVVRDIDKTMKAMWDNFGIGPWYVLERNADATGPTDFIADMTYHGRPAHFSYKAAVTQNKLGGLEYELIQPVSGNTVWGDFLKEHGEGIHHLGWHRVNSLEALADTGRLLEKAGFPCLMSLRVYGIAVAYFDTSKVLNTLLEVVWKDPAKKRIPTRVFPE